MNHCKTIDIIDYVTGIGNYRPPTDNVCNDCAFKRKTCWLHVYDGPRSLYAQSNKVFYHFYGSWRLYPVCFSNTKGKIEQ